MRILGSLFGTFQRLVQFPGAVRSAPDQFDIDTPIQPVWDLSRQAELGGTTRWGGMFNASIDNVHVGAGTMTGMFTTVFPTAVFWSRMGLDPNKHWLWLREATARTDTAATITRAQLAIAQADDGAQFQAHQRQVAVWNRTWLSSMTAGATAWAGINTNAPDPSSGVGETSSPIVVPLPTLITPNAVLHFCSTATAAATIGVDMQFQATPIGVGAFGLM